MAGWTRRVLRSRGIAPLVAVALLAFVGWTLWLASSVHQLRGTLEDHVRWIRVVGDPETPEPALRGALDEMGASALALDATAARRALDDDRFEATRRDELVAGLRAETGRISATLGQRWTQLQLLAALSLALVALVALLFTLARRQVRELDALGHVLAERLEELEERDAELEARLHEIEDREQLLRTVAASVVHEINNPLCYVTMSLGSVERELARLEDAGDASGRLRIMSKRAIEGADRVARIAQDLKRLTAQTASESAPVPIGDLLDTALRLSGGRLKRHDVVRRLPDELPAVLGDRHRLEQVFLNLLLNAGDAFGDGRRGEVVVRAEADGDAVAIEVHDDGDGIAEADLERVFDPFVTTKGDAGTGLGLYVARQIVESHGGLLTLTSREGDGTSVRVVLPVADA
ncbi:MAG TPA: ATP-binding protein [Polyangiaceae bacterium LLY-WYZ-15_(1-7)]|nr:hypothetical protein [Myxococcales bacterium]MAT27386.1 hypothetical protein [Sandaracinus sp.]HJL04835.1 ATP-binding protein [Polyangiaceae bacterium LLY-WYZ-15_(1-7)]MBJ72478.1 hypothetical protein [Sandaracinus sp.]HJL13244.1 ATP-binding protein [Polyangiaceae bacterium LLY-WYZ-15_(1-7)]